MVSIQRFRRGRPKGSTRSAAPRGQHIGPTQELLAKRAMLLGEAARSDLRNRRMTGKSGGDPRAGYPLGVLLARRMISQDEHNAGLWYAWLYRRRFGSPLANASPFFERMMVPSGTSAPMRLFSDDAQRRLEALYQQIDDGLIARAGRPAKQAVQDAAIFESFPKYLDAPDQGWKRANAFRLLRSGLDALNELRTIIVRKKEIK